MRLEHGTWMVVADGEKFLLLRNRGDADYIDLRVVEKELLDNPPAREQATDRAGRMPDDTRSGFDTPGGAPGRSAFEETDWHVLEKRRFARDLADRLEDWSSQGRFDKIVIAADPRSLGVLRDAWGAGLKARIVAEIDKDLTNLPVDRIEQVVVAH